MSYMSPDVLGARVEEGGAKEFVAPGYGQNIFRGVRKLQNLCDKFKGELGDIAISALKVHFVRVLLLSNSSFFLCTGRSLRVIDVSHGELRRKRMSVINNFGSHDKRAL